MLIALDYDKTYDRDHGLWNEFITLAKSHGHLVVCVTCRGPENPVWVPDCHTYYTSFRAKDEFLKARGVKVDIWIDDNPWVILNDIPRELSNV